MEYVVLPKDTTSYRGFPFWLAQPRLDNKAASCLRCDAWAIKMNVTTTLPTNEPSTTSATPEFRYDSQSYLMAVMKYWSLNS
jgi:hypothetical protein